ncbi:MAG: transporter substrate-binding domain-containing protein [Oscillospiraceae bacterium]
MKFLHKKMGLLALFTACLMAFAACGQSVSSSAPAAASGSASADAAGEFRVGMECAYPPFNWTQLDDSNGGVDLGNGTYAGGYDVEIAKLVAESLGKKLVIVKTDWDSLPPSLTSGKIDAVIAGMTNTAERRETLDFTDNYYTSDLVIVVSANGPYANATSLADFEGAKITGQLGTLHYDVIDQIPGVQKQQAMEDFPTMLAALASGMIDGYVSERPGAKSAAATNPQITFVEFAAGSGFDYDGNDVSVAIALRKNETELKDAINAALATISQETREQLMIDALANQPSA